MIEVSRLADVDPELIRDHEDWEVLLGLHAMGRFDGFITNDAAMLQQAPEMIALDRTNLTLVVVDGGDDPMQVTGLVMTYLQEVTRRLDGKVRIYRLKKSALRTLSPWQLLNQIAQHQSTNVSVLVDLELGRMGLPRNRE